MSDQVYRPAKECFKETDTPRAAHLLFQDFQDERTDIGKLPFYMFLQETYPTLRGIDSSNNCLGYKLQYISK
jgi:ferritin